MIFADDIELVKTMTAKYGARGPFVDVGGLVRPTIAQYETTIAEMAKIPVERWFTHGMADENIRRAQYARYQNIERPLSFLGEYEIENPETGGLAIEHLNSPYHGNKYPGTIGTAILLSVLEHVTDPFYAIQEALPYAMAKGGLLIISVPWIFPHHPSPRDHWRFSPTGLCDVVGSLDWHVHEAGWRLRIPANAGVMDVKTGNLQAIESCYIVARRK